jgi:hypothetical protein
MAVGAVFDDVSTKFVGDTFDAVFAMLHGAHYPDRVREVIADRVLEFARNTAEHDPQRLARAVVASLGIKL